MRKMICSMALVAMLSACGGDDDAGNNPTPTPTPTPAPTPTPTPTPTTYGATVVGKGSYARDGTVLLAPAGDTAAPVALPGRIPLFELSGGGLIDMIPDPAFADNGYLYFTATEGSLQTTRMTVVRARLSGAGVGQAITEQTVIWRGPDVTVFPGISRFGGMMAFKDGLLHVAIGDFAVPETAQDLTVPYGKVIRIRTDGSSAPGNPYLDQPGAYGDILTLGHRDPVGLTLGADGRLYETELSPAVGDEINVIESRANYGWPLVSEGNRPDGSPLPRHSTLTGVKAPAYVWPLVSVPGRIIQVRGSIDGLGGEFLVASQNGQRIDRFKVADGTFTTNGNIYLGSFARVLAEKTDGKVYGLTSDLDGEIFRIDRK
jgi:glucose/arabinose dehydrogenase